MKYRLRRQISSVLLVVILIISAIYGLILYPLEKHRQETVIKKMVISLDTIVDQRMQSLGNEIFMQNRAGLQILLQRLAGFEGILVIGAFDRDGRFLASSDGRIHTDLTARDIGSGGNNYLTYETSFGGQAALVFMKPITAIGEKFGYIKVIYVLEDVVRHTRYSVVLYIALLLTILLTLTLIVHFSLFRLVTRPLTSLAEAMARVKTGDLGVQVDIQVENEIGGIADVFNTMSREQSEMYRKLDEANISLEKKVLERTEELRKKNRELETALAEIKTLQGFIPICSNCKKIRDDEGYWKGIEQYIQEHSDAVFSHGICPECVKELYPDIAEKILDNKK